VQIVLSESEAHSARRSSALAVRAWLNIYPRGGWIGDGLWGVRDGRSYPRRLSAVAHRELYVAYVFYINLPIGILAFLG